ncbi:hypothetical protein O4G76_02770 [Limimaricola sp. G21655-S1]|uniref:hypothetical protein n=1 Tax=Limimaricola sp. G21655-S1 TaxID=3014768 RepID=UPI0022AF62A9|nr:hypothetical protein [Limimaricola sp. G21655-S1]MCZ4259766.1 hypothetical protein [Limimaricola sp. G21655-S1]
MDYGGVAVGIFCCDALPAKPRSFPLIKLEMAAKPDFAWPMGAVRREPTGAICSNASSLR